MNGKLARLVESTNRRITKEMIEGIDRIDGGWTPDDIMKRIDELNIKLNVLKNISRTPENLSSIDKQEDEIKEKILKLRKLYIRTGGSHAVIDRVIFDIFNSRHYSHYEP